MVPSEQQEAAGPLPLDDWLTMSDAELAERSHRLAEHDALPVEQVSDNVSQADQQPKVTPTPTSPQLQTAIQLGESLAPFDRMRLIAKLWSTLTPRQRAMLVSIQFDGVGGAVGRVSQLKEDPVVRAVWRFLLDPTNTSGLYSAPRRFDLATIFVVISAYSILFAGLSLADRFLALEFQPQLTLIIGGLVTIVAVAQAWYFGIANPRGVSVIAGALAYTALSCLFAQFAFRSIPGFFFVVVVNGILGGALFGYMAGVFVGSMFLVADLVREKMSASENQSKPVAEHDEFDAPHKTTPANGTGED